MKKKSKRSGKVFWIEKDDNGYFGIGPYKNACDREFPSAISPKMKCGEKIRVRLVEVG